MDCRILERMESGPGNQAKKLCWTHCGVVLMLKEARSTLEEYKETVVTRSNTAADRLENGANGQRHENIRRLRRVADEMQEWAHQQIDALDETTTDTVANCPGPLIVRQTVEENAYETYVCRSSLVREDPVRNLRLPTVTFVNPGNSEH